MHQQRWSEDTSIAEEGPPAVVTDPALEEEEGGFLLSRQTGKRNWDNESQRSRTKETQIVRCAG